MMMSLASKLRGILPEFKFVGEPHQEEMQEEIEEKPNLSRKNVLLFLDTLPPRLDDWESTLFSIMPDLPSGDWIHIKTRFVIDESSVMTAVSQTFALGLDPDSADFRPVLLDCHLWWLLSAQICSVRCTSNTPFIKFSLGDSRPSVARHYYDGKYYLPMPNMAVSRLETRRHAITGLFSGGKHIEYFRSLILKDFDSEHYLVRRKLPLILVLLAWTENIPGEDWIVNAIELHDGIYVVIPKTWYDEFVSVVSDWLRLERLSNLSKLYVSSALSSCQFETEMLIRAISVREDQIDICSEV